MIELTKDTYDSLVESKERPAVVMVKASWCSNCKALAPVYEKFGEDMDGKADAYYLTVDDNQSFARSLKIMGVPTILFYRHGVLMAKKIGNQSVRSLTKTIAPLFALDKQEAKDNEYRSLISRIFGRK